MLAANRGLQGESVNFTSNYRSWINRLGHLKKYRTSRLTLHACKSTNQLNNESDSFKVLVTARFTKQTPQKVKSAEQIKCGLNCSLRAPLCCSDVMCVRVVEVEGLAWDSALDDCSIALFCVGGLFISVIDGSMVNSVQSCTMGRVQSSVFTASLKLWTTNYGTMASAALNLTMLSKSLKLNLLSYSIEPCTALCTWSTFILEKEWGDSTNLNTIWFCDQTGISGS